MAIRSTAPRWAPTDATLALLTHDAVLFTDGLGIYDDGPALVTEAGQGRAVAAALGSRRAALLRNHGVVIAGEDVRWAVLTAVTLERAVRFQSIAASLGAPRPIPAASAESCDRRNTRSVPATTTGPPGSAGWHARAGRRGGA